MQHLYLDSNIIIRFLTNDDEIQSPIAFKVFEKAVRREYTLVLSPIIVAECICVLQMKRYGYKKSEITNKFTQLILAPGIKTIEEEVTLKSLSDFSQYNVDFIDAYLSSTSYLEKNNPIITWNKKDFARLGCEFYSPEDLI